MKSNKRSPIIGALARIARCAEEQKITSVAEEFAFIQQDSLKYGNKWQQPNHPLRLEQDEIRSISKKLPFDLSVEFYDFYSLCNGYLPIEQDVLDRDGDSLDNYFIYRSLLLAVDGEWQSLEGCVDLYQSVSSFLNDISKSRDRLRICRYSQENSVHKQLISNLISNPSFPTNILPLMSTEDGIYAAVSDTVQQETSIIIFFDPEFLEISFIAPSLTNFMLAEAEFMEASAQPEWNKSKKIDILEQYDIGQYVVSRFEIE